MASMPKTTPQPASPSRLDEGIGLVLFVLALVVLLSLISFHPTDPSWNVAGHSTAIHNWIGPVGAVLADLLFQILGLAAFAVPVLMGHIGVRSFRGLGLHPSPLQLGGVVLLFASLTGLLSLFPEFPFYRETVRHGGALGYLVTGWLESGFSRLGAALLLLLLAVIALMLATDFSPRGTLGRRLGLDALRRWWERRRAGDAETVYADPRIQEDALLKTGVPVPSEEPDGRRFGLFKSKRRSANLSEEEEKALSEKLVVESLYDDLRAEVRTGSGPIKLVSDPPPIPAAVPPSVNGVEKPSADRVTSDFIESREDIPSFTVFDSRPVPVTPPPSNTRRVVREALAQHRAQTTGEQAKPVMESPAAQAAAPAKSKPTAVPPPGQPDPVVANMVRGASIVRKAEEPPPPTIAPPVAPSPVAPPNRRTVTGGYLLPSVQMLHPAPPRQEQADEELWERARLLAEKCKEFNVTGQIQHINPGPVVTTFEFKPDPGVKYSRVANLTDDLCLALKAESVRIDRLPGKSTVGIEVPNAKREVIHLREIAESEKYADSPSPLTIGLGKTIEGHTYVADLMKMPHLLIAGSTGSGKSVMVNTLICSILLKASPADVKMIMVDPKRLELGLYEGIPHLLTPIVTDPKRASNALKWAVSEMENRYKQLSGFAVRNIAQFNKEICESADVSRFGLEEPPPKLPYIVIVIDELADLMMVASSDVETSITRLAQMARAVGIHLVVATQRPSVDVITGLIKANFPARMSFRVSSKVDSRTILDTNGAELLLGQGDMLFLPPGTSRLIRVHGSYVGEAEIYRIVDHIKAQGEPQYDESIQMSDAEAELAEAGLGDRDELYNDAMREIVKMGKASTSVLQRRLRIGYGRAAAMLDMMEAEGYVGPSEGSKPRIVKQAAYDYVEMLDGHALNGDDL